MKDNDEAFKSGEGSVSAVKMTVCHYANARNIELL